MKAVIRMIIVVSEEVCSSVQGSIGISELGRSKIKSSE
jgi:hypothetical protein